MSKTEDSKKFPLGRDPFGTPIYGAPETFGVEGTIIGRAVDIFSLGCVYLVLLNMLTGRPPKLYNLHRRDKYCADKEYQYAFRGNTAASLSWFDDLPADSTDKAILKIATEMIEIHPVRRPDIEDVRQRVRVIISEELEETHCKTPTPGPSKAGQGKEDAQDSTDDEEGRKLRKLRLHD